MCIRDRFGTAEAAPGSQNVSLKFKRMTVPVIILDENDRPYEGEAKVELSLKNEGTQDLLNGTIEINENAPVSYTHLCYS